MGHVQGAASADQDRLHLDHRSEDEDDPSLVTIIIEPEPDGPGAVVTLYHEMDAQWADAIEQTERGWIAMLMGIDAMLIAEGVMS